MASMSETVAAYLGHTEEDVLAVAARAPRRYKRYFIPKKRGGMRAIHHPAKETKALQYALMETLLGRLKIHDSALAYRRELKAPLRQNAMAHAGCRYTIKMDFQDFFHSIQPADLFDTLQRNGETFSAEDGAFLTRCLFIGVAFDRKGLPIGAPSSPSVSNAVMYGFDRQMQAAASAISEEAVYTRYADDIVFSSNERGACQEFHEHVTDALPRLEHPKLRTNPRKTVYSSRGTRRVVTGIVIGPDGRISLGRVKKRYIRKLIFDFSRNNLDPESRTYLSGYLAFIMDVEPEFYDRLVLKYSGETVNQALKG